MPTTPAPDGPRLLSGGNPRVPKGEGDGPVQAYIAAMPGWKRDAGEEIDRLVTRTVPLVAKAVKWNTPLYGADPGRWFLAFHCFDRYVKVTFFDGAALTPPPPEPSKQPRVRYLHVREGGLEDPAQVAAWILQAAALPGERL